MDEDKHAWEQMIEEGESDLWYGRFTLFRHLGAKRTVAAVYRKENRVKPRQTVLKIPGDWYESAKKWKWEERARAYYDYITKEEDAVIEEERNKVIRSGYALAHKRIRLLEKILAKLIRMQEEEDKVWLKETKTTTSTYGEDKSTVIVIEKTVFNAPLFLLIDKYLNSIASEMGERVKKKALEEEEGDTEFTIRLVGKPPDEAEE